MSSLYYPYDYNNMGRSCAVRLCAACCVHLRLQEEWKKYRAVTCAHLFLHEMLPNDRKNCG